MVRLLAVILIAAWAAAAATAATPLLTSEPATVTGTPLLTIQRATPLTVGGHRFRARGEGDRHRARRAAEGPR
jgi:hypothetical protein